jgi:hypothetical protein
MDAWEGLESVAQCLGLCAAKDVCRARRLCGVGLLALTEQTFHTRNYLGTALTHTRNAPAVETGVSITDVFWVG